MNDKDMSDKDIALKSMQTMLASDEASRSLGMEFVDGGSGWGEVKMRVRKDMVNGHDIAHGGIVFALGDTAFACACNSHNIVNVAASCHINFIRPALLGDVLTAKATELSRGKRSGVSDIRIENQGGKLVAMFRGHSMSLGKPIF